MRLYDDKTTIHIAENTMFHERTKHIKVDCYIVRKKFEKKIIVGIIWTPVSRSSYQTLGRTRVDFICDKLGMYDIYAPI